MSTCYNGFMVNNNDMYENTSMFFYSFYSNLHDVQIKLKHFPLKTYKDKRFIGAILGQSRKQENSQIEKICAHIKQSEK